MTTQDETIETPGEVLSDLKVISTNHFENEDPDNVGDCNTIKWREGYATMDLNVLTRTASFENVRGAIPRNRPIEHYNLLKEIKDIIRSILKTDAVMSPIIAQESKALIVMYDLKTQPKETCPVEHFLIQRVMTKFNIIANNDDEINMSIAVSYTEQGISIAFGANVWACNNLAVFGENIWSTYGPSKVPFEDGMQLIRTWLYEFAQKRQETLDIIENLKNFEISKEKLYLLYGILIERALLNNKDKANYREETPFNVTQVHRIIENINELYESYLEDNKPFTSWDLSNAGTFLLKPKTADMPAIIQSSKIWNDMVITFSTTELD